MGEGMTENMMIVDMIDDRIRRLTELRDRVVEFLGETRRVEEPKSNPAAAGLFFQPLPIQRKAAPSKPRQTKRPAKSNRSAPGAREEVVRKATMNLADFTMPDLRRLLPAMPSGTLSAMMHRLEHAGRLHAVKRNGLKHWTWTAVDKPKRQHAAEPQTADEIVHRMAQGAKEDGL